MAVPLLMPLTTPVGFTLAIAALLVVHVPPPIVEVSVVVDPVQTVVAPDIVPAADVVLIVTVAVAVAVPQLLATL